MGQDFVARVREALGGPSYRRLFEEVRRRVEEAGFAEVGGEEVGAAGVEEQSVEKAGIEEAGVEDEGAGDGGAIKSEEQSVEKAGIEEAGVEDEGAGDGGAIKIERAGCEKAGVEEAGFAEVGGEESEVEDEGAADGGAVEVEERARAAPSFKARTVTLSGLSKDEREAIADLHGLPKVPGERFTVNLLRLDDALRKSRLHAGLLDVLEALFGPLKDRKAARRSASSLAEKMWAGAAGHPAMERHPELSTWLDGLRRSGALTRAAQRWPDGPAGLMRPLLCALERLPSEPPVMLQVLATELVGDAHALDPGRPLAGLLMSALAAMAGEVTPVDAEARRMLWARFGVLCDALSSHVLVLGLRTVGSDPISKHLLEWSRLGEPARVTLRALRRLTVVVEPGSPVHVCENPAVVALAADRLGPECPPLVCTEGVPSLAVWHLLSALSEAGAEIHFHADFDWGGVRIGNLLHSRLGARPWRMAARDYRELAGRLAGPPLAGEAVDAAWDSALAPTMREAGAALFEEQTADLLIRDLAGVFQRSPDIRE